MTWRFVVVAEDELGYRLVRDLADRVVAERGAPWLHDLWDTEKLRAEQRTWSGFEPGSPWSSWREVKRLADQRSLRAQGLGMKAERAMAHKAVAIAADLSAGGPRELAVHALFLMHDTDGDDTLAERMRDGAGGQGGKKPGFEVLVAAPHPESEAWVIAGALLASHEERARHEAERKRLGFDPITQPGRLSSNRQTDKRDAKRVCEAILGPSGEDHARWEPSWLEAPLDHLEQNAAGAGLRAYTEQVEARIFPLLGDHAPR